MNMDAQGHEAISKLEGEASPAPRGRPGRRGAEEKTQAVLELLRFEPVEGGLVTLCPQVWVGLNGSAAGCHGWWRIQGGRPLSQARMAHPGHDIRSRGPWLPSTLP